MTAFEKVYQDVFGNFGDMKSAAISNGWSIAKDSLSCSPQTFRRQANKAGWGVYDHGYNFYLKWKGGKK